jgi:hypothetical protein
MECCEKWDAYYQMLEDLGIFEELTAGQLIDFYCDGMWCFFDTGCDDDESLVDAGKSDVNFRGTTGPVLQPNIGPLFAGDGGALQLERDAALASNGLAWVHVRSYNSLLDSTDSGNNTTQGWLWRNNHLMNLEQLDGGDQGDSDILMTVDAHTTQHYTNTAHDTWTSDDYVVPVLSLDDGSDEFTVSKPNGTKFVFHDFDATNAGKLKRIEDGYGNSIDYTYDGSNRIDYITDEDDHKFVYEYYAYPDANEGKLKSIKTYKALTVSNANLVAQMDYVYHDGGGDPGGSLGDLILVTKKLRATSDADGTLSITRTTHYRYWTDSYDTDTNPGTNHKLKYVVLPENFNRFDATYDYDSATDGQVADYANTYYEYDSNYRVRQVQERGASCSACGGGSTLGTTDYAWTENGTPPGDYNTWNLHVVVDRPDDTRVILDMNKAKQPLTMVFQDEDDGSPTLEWILHLDYTAHNRVSTIARASANSAYDESAPYGVTQNSGAGLITEFEYFSAGSYEDYLKVVKIKQGTSGSAIKVSEFGRTITERPDLATSVTRYESDAGGGSDGRTVSVAHTFYDMDKVQVKQIEVTQPTITTAKNGPNVAAVTKGFFDTTGRLRWRLDPEGYVSYYGHDASTGMNDFFVADVDTGSLPAGIDDDWDGTTYGFGADDDVPFARSGGGAALNIDWSATYDWLGRVRKTTDAEGIVNYFVYKNAETRVYRAWQGGAVDKPMLGTTIQYVDQEGRLERSVQLKNDVTISLTADEPNGAESFDGDDEVSRTVRVFDTAGLLTEARVYHNIPTNGDGSEWSEYYSTFYEYDDMGRPTLVIQDVRQAPNQFAEDVEQVTETVYDAVGRVIETKEGVSGDGHDVGASAPYSKPTMVTLSKMFYDDPDTDSTPEQGVGDGNLSWTLSYFGTGGGDHNDTEYRYDWRNRRQLVLPPDKPYSLVKHDNLNRVTAAAT